MASDAERIEQLETCMRVVGGVLRMLSHNPDCDEDMAEALHLLASVLEHPEVAR